MKYNGAMIFFRLRSIWLSFAEEKKAEIAE